MSEQHHKLPLALIIEDDYDAAIIFDEALQAAGFDTEIISDGQQALHRLDNLVPQLIALDLHLPQISGRTILNKIRADKRLCEISVIIVTADPSLADILHENADLILLKPISYKQLRDLAARLRPPDVIGEN